MEGFYRKKGGERGLRTKKRKDEFGARTLFVWGKTWGRVFTMQLASS